MAPRARAKNAETLKLRPADPFDLIRWLARSQSDPRKAVAELVQNSIDANARCVRIERRRMRRAMGLCIWDDGEGIIADLTREEALRAIATNIGHSRKRGLSPRERHEQVVAGKYGIGLLGFWSVGRTMEIRSRVAGSPLVVLRLEEDRERAEIARLATPIGAAETYTEIVIADLHEPAQRVLSGRRLAEYLSAELRGAILASGVSIEVHDGIARGLAQKRFGVVPKRFTGERLALPLELETPGFPPIRLELYVARGGEPAAIQVSCAGTLVADDMSELAAFGLDVSPWVGENLAGLIDFPGFNVPPGTRRGVAPDGAAAAFVETLSRLEPLVAKELRRLERERGAIATQKVVQDLRRALRGLRSRLPQYELPTVPGGQEDGGAAPTPGGPLALTPPETEAEAPLKDDASGEGDLVDDDRPAGGGQEDLFPPGPLDAVRIKPEHLVLAPGSERRARAVPVDDAGKRITEGVTFSWVVSGPAGLEARSDGSRAALFAHPQVSVAVGQTASLRVVARQDEREVEGSALVSLEETKPADNLFGIPEPELVDDPGGTWRSRWAAQRWQVNSGHADYMALRNESRGRFRYLLALLAKEIANRTHGVPGSDTVLESMVEILAHAERNLSGKEAASGAD